MMERTEQEVITEAYSDEAAKNWRAPVQGYPAGIPWPIHLEAYEVYAKKWTKQTAIIDLNGRCCRGGFSIGELDDLIPGWRERVSYIGRLETTAAELLRFAENVRDYARETDDESLYAAADDLISKAEAN
jgi:hypothetical protein